MPDSHRPRPHAGSPVVHEWTCPTCGNRYLAQKSQCPRCASTGGTHTDEELTKKVIDDNDLKKGF